MIQDIIGPHRRLLLICIAISFVLYMVAAWHSAIYLHPDEHYQIVEFASYKMGITHADQLAWEFGEKIRPAAQPLLCYTLLKTFNALSVTDHFTQLLLLRVLSALLSLLSVTLLCVSALPQIKAPYQRIFIISSFLFFYPYTYGVHFSSETWSGSMVMIAVSLLAFHYYRAQSKPALPFLSVGALLGVAFLFRFQTALMTIGILAWLLFVKKERSHLLYIITAGLSMVALGALADHWLYGEWIFIPWRYFDSAFIHKHTDFGDQPLYFFPLFFLFMLTPPIGMLVLIALIVFAMTQRRTLYAWALLPFLLMHILIPHKEWRFLYPVISFFPLIVVLAWQGWRERSWPMHGPIKRIAVITVVAFNLIGVLIFILCAHRILFDQKIFLARIHEIAKTQKVLLYVKDINNSPYTLPKATIPKDLDPVYMLDKNVSQVSPPDIASLHISSADTVLLLSTNLLELRLNKSPDEYEVIQRTLFDLSWLQSIVGTDGYRQIEANTYQLIQL